MYEELKSCRICGGTELTEILNLGDQALTGKFPKTKTEKVASMPLVLVKCMGSEACGLVQLKHTGDLSDMYGSGYGYRSGLNESMVKHLQGKVAKIRERVKLVAGDLVLDIGSNDSTLLQSYPKDLKLVGVDPSGPNFKQFYPPHIGLIPEFFSQASVEKSLGTAKAKVITSISMFYDLPDPTSFVRQVHQVLDSDGIWVFEQSYMPTMLEMNSYDTVCHEHLEYYALHQIKWMCDRVGFQILDIEFNDINGGSFSVMAAKKGSKHKAGDEQVSRILEKERKLGLHTLKPYQEFAERVDTQRTELKEFLATARRQGKKVFGYGASTKGNVLLQYCGITEADLPCIAEVNPDKFGSFTPGTLIPIVSEAEAKKMKPDYFMVLPWHFRKNILGRETGYMDSGGKMVFPLPRLDVI